MIELWKMSPGATASPAERQWVDRIGAAARRLARTVERMLKLVRNRDFSQSLDTADRSPSSRWSSQVVDELSPISSCAADGHRRDRSRPGPDRGRPDKIADVLINLLANAVKFTPDGGTIRLERPRPSPAIRTRSASRSPTKAPASRADDQQHLFEPFFTGFDTLRHSSGDYQFGKRGIGLGLCLVKTFVELHGGRVEVSSTPGSGSTFAFVLPRSQINRVQE